MPKEPENEKPPELATTLPKQVKHSSAQQQGGSPVKAQAFTEDETLSHIAERRNIIKMRLGELSAMAINLEEREFPKIEKEIR